MTRDEYIKRMVKYWHERGRNYDYRTFDHLIRKDKDDFTDPFEEHHYVKVKPPTEVERENCLFCKNIKNGFGEKMKVSKEGISGYEPRGESYGDGCDIMLNVENNALLVDNSAGEYPHLGIRIYYCPFCGRKLDE